MSNIGKAKKKPVTIEFIQWNGSMNSTKEVSEFMSKDDVINLWNCSKGLFAEYHKNCLHFGLEIETLEGVMKASVNDFIIKGINGEFYPCKPDIFHKTYDIL